MIGSPLVVVPHFYIDFLVTDGKKESRAVLELRNSSTVEHVGFKLIPSDAKRYLIFPHCAVLPPNSRIEVSVLLRPPLSNQLKAAGNRLLLQSWILHHQGGRLDSAAAACDSPASSHSLTDRAHDRRKLLILVNGADGREHVCPRMSHGAPCRSVLWHYFHQQPGHPEDLRIQYDQLLDWAMDLERDKRHVTTELIDQGEEAATLEHRLRVSQKQVEQMTFALAAMQKHQVSVQKQLEAAQKQLAALVIFLTFANSFKRFYYTNRLSNATGSTSDTTTTTQDPLKPCQV